MVGTGGVMAQKTYVNRKRTRTGALIKTYPHESISFPDDKGEKKYFVQFRNGTYTTDIKKIQDAIERSSRFKRGDISIVSPGDSQKEKAGAPKIKKEEKQPDAGNG